MTRRALPLRVPPLIPIAAALGACEPGPPRPSADMPGFASPLPLPPRPATASASAPAPAASATPALTCPPERVALSHGGSVYLCEGGAPRRLSMGPADRGAALSPGGKAVAFARDQGVTHVTLFAPAQRFSKPKPTESGWVEVADTLVLVVDAATGQELARVGNRDACLTLSAPSWVDDATLLVDSRGFGVPNVHNRATCLVDVPTSRVWLLASRASCVEPIRKGPHAGRFYASGFDMGESGLVDLFAIVDRQGKRVRRFAEDPFQFDWDGDGRITDSELAMPCAPQLAKAHAAKVQSTLEGLR